VKLLLFYPKFARIALLEDEKMSCLLNLRE